MKIKMKKVILGLAICTFLGSTSCDKLAEKVVEMIETDVELNDINLNFEALFIETSLSKKETRSSAGETMPFSTTYSLSLSSPDLAKFSQYADHVKSVSVTGAKIVAKINGEASDKSIYNFKVNSPDLNGNWTVPTYRYGNTFIAESQQVAFVQELLEAVMLKSKTVNITISGESDIVTATKLNITITVSGKLRVTLVADAG
jgi:hypothetical protein